MVVSSPDGGGGEEEEEIRTRAVVNCAGAWSCSVAEMAGLTIPLVAMKHAYVTTERMEVRRFKEILFCGKQVQNFKRKMNEITCLAVGTINISMIKIGNWPLHIPRDFICEGVKFVDLFKS